MVDAYVSGSLFGCKNSGEFFYLEKLSKEHRRIIRSLIHNPQTNSDMSTLKLYGVDFEFPFKSDEDNLKFIAGYIDSTADLFIENEDLKLTIKCRHNMGSTTLERNKMLQFLMDLQKYLEIPCVVDNIKLYVHYTFTNLIDVFGKLGKFSHIKKYELGEYMTIKLSKNIPKCLLYKRDPNAILPYKSRLSDVGYDLSVIREHKKLTSNTILYDTGISLKIPFGYYAEIVPRSSLSKTGYMVANSIGIIDRSYTGNLYVALCKITEDAMDISQNLPFRCCQIIFRKQEFIDLEEIAEDVEQTTRNSGGYGSTG